MKSGMIRRIESEVAMLNGKKMTPKEFWVSVGMVAKTRIVIGGDDQPSFEAIADLMAGQTKYMLIEKELFKELLELVLNLPEFGSKLTAVDADCCSTPTGETLVRLKPGDFLLRLSSALGACG